MAKKRKTLPKNFDELLEEGDLKKLKEVFEKCEINAYGGYGKQTALAFDLCPDELARWLVEQGADLSFTDTWGNSALHSRAYSRRTSFKVLLELGADVTLENNSTGTPLHVACNATNAENAQLLLEYGADIHKLNKLGLTPLELALQRCNNSDIENMVKLSQVLLSAGAVITTKAKEFVEEVGKRFEFHRDGFASDSVEQVSNALDELYIIYNIPPVTRRAIHDGNSAINVKSETWQKQHEELWLLLVPSSGHCRTIQGEVVRISGRIATELHGNGGGNWDSDYRKMADAFLEYLNQGKPLSESELVDAKQLISEIKKMYGDTNVMAQLAVKWILQNPKPIKLVKPSYER
ncbi:MAG: ankyrin repeat domain-containing protein [Lentisphaeraceae bacterium]|nr:ankyrin repeat domain-containing protein [Lentisphaeraceae bacterium]